MSVSVVNGGGLVDSDVGQKEVIERFKVEVCGEVIKALGELMPKRVAEPFVVLHSGVTKLKEKKCLLEGCVVQLIEKREMNKKVKDRLSGYCAELKKSKEETKKMYERLKCEHERLKKAMEAEKREGSPCVGVKDGIEG